MSDELKNMLDSLVTFVINKIDQKELPEIQKKYDQIIELFNKLSILTKEDFEYFEKTINESDSLQEQVKAYKAQKEIDEDKIKSMMTELANNMELTEKHKKLNEDYNNLLEKYNVCYNENAEKEMKLKNNENLINDLNKEISNVKKENFEKFEKIINYVK